MPAVRILGTLLLVGSLAGFLSACGSSSRGGGGAGTAQRGSYKVGAPYKIDGVTYTPQEEFNRTETGVASWYGPGFHGKSTANGERYDQSERTAAHRTLQMPAIVRVTNLDNGMSTVVRINDRGPFARSRVIDLSRTAAQELDIVRNGTARVRIDQLPAESMAVRDVAISGGGPAEQNAAVAQVASGQRTAPAATVAAAPPPGAVVIPPQPQPVVVPSQPAPQPQPVWPTTPQPPSVETPVAHGGRGGGLTVASLASGAAAVPASTSALAGSGFYVQTGAFSTMENAERQRGAVRSYGTSEVSQASAGGRDVWRVRLGPYTTADAAGIVADRLKRSGYGDARVVSE
ncbi:MAG: septal ring lytic transglycosylase RlpA family protein [Rhodospirillales bacterium]|nr:septal ring lytic transglycosylase RlpA family protein [Rhodospirillales bacterium]